ncbi:hypothetical protein [Tuanshanicoccus lijuaniae]
MLKEQWILLDYQKIIMSVMAFRLKESEQRKRKTETIQEIIEMDN